jgi:hypothetical protein
VDLSRKPASVYLIHGDWARIGEALETVVGRVEMRLNDKTIEGFETGCMAHQKVNLNSNQLASKNILLINDYLIRLYLRTRFFKCCVFSRL